VLEIDRLRHHAKNGTVPHGKRPKVQTGAVDTFIADLEDERDYWRRQVGELQQLLRSKSSSRSLSRTAARRSRSPSLSPTQPAATQTSRTTSPTRGKTVSRSTSPVVSPAKKVRQYGGRNCVLLLPYCILSYSTQGHLPCGEKSNLAFNFGIKLDC